MMANDWWSISSLDAGFAPNVDALLDDAERSGALANLYIPALRGA